MKISFTFVASGAILGVFVFCACTSGGPDTAPPQPQKIAAPNGVVPMPPPAPRAAAAPPVSPPGFQPSAPVIASPPMEIPEFAVTPSSASNTEEGAPLAKKKAGGGKHEDSPTIPKVPSGPSISKQEAEQILRPKILACMKQEQVYYLIVRVGQGFGKFKPEELPPLTIVEDSDVNYRAVPRLEKTALGKCILAAAAPIRTSAFRSNYIHFALTNPSAPDPLEGASARISQEAADQALSALDNEARGCRQKFPIGEWEGRTINMNVLFYGVDGSVKRVEVFYIESKTALGKCLSAVYKKAKVPRFRQEEESVHHDLKP